MITQKIAILNQKGGVGKTTTAINVASYLQSMEKSVLLVDLDPQGNATSGLGIPKNQQESTSYELLLGNVDLARSTQEAGETGVAVVPANASLAAAEVDLVQLPERESRLKEALGAAVYDYVLIDCPPSLGLLSINALVAADWVLIPVQAEYYALEGLSQLLEVVQRVRAGLNPSLDLMGVVVTMYDSRTTLSENVYNELKKHFGAKLFDTVVPRNIRLAEAPSYGKSIAEHDKWSKGARAYKQLAKELNNRVEKG